MLKRQIILLLNSYKHCHKNLKNLDTKEKHTDISKLIH